MLAGAQVGNATVERGTRTSADRLTTVSRRDGDSWVLNGKKYYATGALGAGWIAVAARIPDTEPSHGATVFVRPSDPGVTLNLDRWSAFGQRGTASGEVILDQVVVDDAFVIDEGPDPDPVDRAAGRARRIRSGAARRGGHRNRAGRIGGRRASS